MAQHLADKYIAALQLDLPDIAYARTSNRLPSVGSGIEDELALHAGHVDGSWGYLKWPALAHRERLAAKASQKNTRWLAPTRQIVNSALLSIALSSCYPFQRT